MARKPKGLRYAKKRRKKTQLNPNVPFYIFTSLLVLMIIVAIISIFFTDNSSKETGSNTAGANIYFLDVANDTLKPEVYPLTATENTEIVKFVLQELVIGPKTVGHSSPVPLDIIKSATISGTNVDVSVTENYNNLRLNEEIICRSAIVCTLTDLPFVDTVSITVNGSPLLKPNGQELGKIKADDIVTNPDIAPQEKSPKTITLYFADASETGLVKEQRTISTDPNEPITKYIVTELINGPRMGNHKPTVPPETKLLEISTSEGICYVDLSKEFITKHTGGPTAELLTIYSIVNSLAEQSDVKSVQFWIEGERQELFKGSVDFSNLFEAKDIPTKEEK